MMNKFSNILGSGLRFSLAQVNSRAPFLKIVHISNSVIDSSRTSEIDNAIEKVIEIGTYWFKLGWLKNKSYEERV